MNDVEVMQKAVDALLLWEEMHPKTNASGVRNAAIEALQARIYYHTEKKEVFMKIRDRLDAQ